jgi:hypothetical protein
MLILPTIILIMSALMVSSKYKIIETEATGEVHIMVDSQYNNIKASRVIVDEGVKARLFGTINEKLIIKKGARVNLHGTIKGTIENEGELYIFQSN